MSCFDPLQPCLQEYLRETLVAVEEVSAEVTVNESHRKSMIGALLGVSKATIESDLRDLQVKIGLEKAHRFVEEELSSLKRPPSPDKAPMYEEGIETYKLFPTPNKLFSFLARGRTYKGKLESLLLDVQPELVPIHDKIVQGLNAKELLRVYADCHPAVEGDDTLKQQLIQCIDLELPKAKPQSRDGGKSSGEKGETDLQTYLQEQKSDKVKILAPVWIQLKNGKRSSKCEHILELPTTAFNDLHGMTSEWDAAVVETLDQEKVKISQVWEAKACLHPITIQDALEKKYDSVKVILEQDGIGLISNGQRSSIVKESPTACSLGIFGTTLLDPKSAARRSVMVLGEKMLGVDKDAVQEALANGFIEVPKERVVHRLRLLLELVENIQPQFVVSSMLGPST